MMFVFFLFILLISLSNCMIKVDFRNKTLLSNTPSGYFYFDGGYHRENSYIYLFFEDDGYKLNYNSLQICVTEHYPKNDDISCSYSIEPVYKVTQLDSKYEYLYFFRYKRVTPIYVNYVVVKYSGSGKGNLYVENSDDDIHRYTLIDYRQKTLLESLYSGYFYFQGNPYISTGNVYLYFEDDEYKFLYYALNVCFTNVVPYDGMTCSYKEFSASKRIQIGSKYLYAYYFSYKSTYGKYILVTYNGNGKGKLYVEISNDDIHGFIPIGYEKKTLLSNTTNGFFHLDAKYYLMPLEGHCYLYFEDFGYNLNYNLLQICLLKENPYDGIYCSYRAISPAYRNNDGSKSEYLYYFDYKSSDGNFILVKYTGPGNGRLYVETSNKDLHELLPPLSVIAIVLIAIGSLIVVGAVVVVIICCYKCRKKNRANKSEIYPLIPPGKSENI